MKNDQFSEVVMLIDKNQISEAEFKLSKFHKQYHSNPDYLFLRSKIFYINKLYYLAIDTLFIALEFSENEKIFSLLGEIYKNLGNEEFSKKIFDKNLRTQAVNEVKDTMTGLFRKKNF